MEACGTRPPWNLRGWGARETAAVDGGPSRSPTRPPHIVVRGGWRGAALHASVRHVGGPGARGSHAAIVGAVTGARWQDPHVGPGASDPCAGSLTQHCCSQGVQGWPPCSLRSLAASYWTALQQNAALGGKHLHCSTRRKLGSAPSTSSSRTTSGSRCASPRWMTATHRASPFAHRGPVKPRAPSWAT